MRARFRATLATSAVTCQASLPCKFCAHPYMLVRPVKPAASVSVDQQAAVCQVVAVIASLVAQSDALHLDLLHASAHQQMKFAYALPMGWIPNRPHVLRGQYAPA